MVGGLVFPNVRRFCGPPVRRGAEPPRGEGGPRDRPHRLALPDGRRAFGAGVASRCRAPPVRAAAGAEDDDRKLLMVGSREKGRPRRSEGVREAPRDPGRPRNPGRGLSLRRPAPLASCPTSGASSSGSSASRRASWRRRSGRASTSSGRDARCTRSRARSTSSRPRTTGERRAKTAERPREAEFFAARQVLGQDDPPGHRRHQRPDLRRLRRQLPT